MAILLSSYPTHFPIHVPRLDRSSKGSNSDRRNYKSIDSVQKMSNIRPFRIAIPDSRLERLRAKLALTDFPSELETDISNPWSRGPLKSSVKQLADYWLNHFDWRKAEASLNDNFPQFTATIYVSGFGNYDIHFIHLRSKVKNAIPLIFLHGWPGSFYEGTKIAHPLINGDGHSQPAFHVVIPSLVDHGFSSSSRTVRQGTIFQRIEPG